MANKRKKESSEDIIKKYKKKIEELERKQRQKRRRIILESSSESDHSTEDLDNRVKKHGTSDRVFVSTRAIVEPSRNTEAGPSTSTEAGPSTSTEAGPSTSTEAGPSPSSETGRSSIGETSRSSNSEAGPSSNTEAGPSFNTRTGVSSNIETESSPTIEQENIEVPAASQDEQILNQEAGDLPELDPELLRALGEETGNISKYGEKIHQSLSRRWEPILKKGLPKDVKEALLKEHLVPENCTLLQAPRLNAEAAAAVSETVRNRDKRKESDQQQLGIGISVISKAMTILLTSENKIEAIRVLSDGCRILSDLHFSETQSRISVVNYALAKPFLNVVQDSERDETLYGNKLAEKIKASKVIEKQGMQIKKYTKTPRTSMEPPPTNTRPQHAQPATNQGNWYGPPRFQQNRGGRKGQRRQPAAPNRRPPPPPQLTWNAASQAKPRAPRN